MENCEKKENKNIESLILDIFKYYDISSVNIDLNDTTPCQNVCTTLDFE